jgi:hypothetical protein
MTEEVGEFGSGTPSPLHKLCELIEKLYEVEQCRRREISGALEMAQYPLTFLSASARGYSARPIPSGKTKHLLKNVSDAVFDLGGRDARGLESGRAKRVRAEDDDVPARSRRNST